MKFSKVYVDRNQLAKRLGVDTSQIVIAEVESSLNEITITLVVDNNVELKSDIDAVTLIHGGDNLRRFKLIEDTEDLKKQTLELQSQNLKLHQEIAELQNNVVKLQLQLFEDKRKDNVTVNMDTNKWITGSSTGDTIQGILDKEFNLAKDSIIGGTIDDKDATIKIPKGEYIIPKSDAEKLLKQLDVEKEKLESIKKQKEELEEKIHSHDTDKNEFKGIDKALEDLTNVFTINLNGFNTKDKTANEVIEQLAKNIRESGFKF